MQFGLLTSLDAKLPRGKLQSSICFVEVEFRANLIQQARVADRGVAD